MTTISGTINNGVTLSAGGDTNPVVVTGTINNPANYGTALYGFGIPWTIVNQGVVRGFGTASRGIRLAAGGTIENSGLVEATYRTVEILGSPGVVNNSGTILGTLQGAGGFAVNLAAGGDVINSGLIHGANDGVGVVTNLTNTGTIVGDISFGVDGGAGGTAGTITNGAGALIAGARGIRSGATLVSNSGGIIGTAGYALRLFGADAALVNNTGTIQGSAGPNVGADGITFDTFNTDGTVVNGTSLSTAGLIRGTQAIAFQASGTVINHGSIDGAVYSAIFIGGGGTVSNFGTITGHTDGVLIASGGRVINGSASSTAASIIGYDGQGVRIGTTTGTVTNFGTISGHAVGIELNSGGTITNGSATSTTASIRSTTLGGIYVFNAAATVNNFGSIYGYFSGVRLSAGGLVANKVSGSIGATNQGVGVYVIGGGGTVTNLGTIQGAVAVAIESGTVTNGSASVSSALIASRPSGRGIVLGSGGGAINNFASVVAGYAAIEIDNGGSVTNQAGGVIVGDLDGILVRGAGTATLTNSGTIVGATGVSMPGTASAAVILTNAGTISGTAGVAVQLGGGDDQVIVDAGAVFNGLVDGGGGADLLTFSQAGAISLAGFSGFETIQLSGGGANTLSLSNANFANVTGALVHVIGGKAGNTVDASGLSAPNRLVFTGGPGADHATGGAGDDLFQFAATGLGAGDTVIGGGGNDTLSLTTAGTIQLGGVSGIETIMLGGGIANSVTLTDANFVGVSGTMISVFAASGATTVNASGLSGGHGLSFFGGAGNDKATGGAGFDLLNGGGGADTLDGGAGADTLFGGAGNDTYIVDNAGDLVSETGGGVDLVKTSLAAYTLSPNVENLIFIGTGGFIGTGNGLNNTITGGADDDTLNGGNGDDTLNGGGGQDTLNGGTGADTMTGGGGGDTYLVDNVGDVVVEIANQGIDTVQTILAGYTLGDNVENLSFTGAGSFSGTGNALANAITGGGGGDTLTGGDGADTLDGGAGADTLIGGTGSDTYIVDDVGDIVSESGGGVDLVKTSLAAYTLTPNVENLIFIGAGGFTGTGNGLNNTITGGASGDTLTGGGGGDTLNGGMGADTLGGGLGNDLLTGGPGPDSFLFDTALNAATNVDQIFDFNSVGDQILLSHSIFTAAGPVGTLAAGAFVIGSSAADASDRIVYDSATGALSYDSDGTGATAQIQFATLSTSLTLSNTNFQIV